MRLGVRTAFREGLARTSHHEFSAFLGKSRQPAKKAFLQASAKLWSAAACCRFFASQLAGGHYSSFPPDGTGIGWAFEDPRASSRVGKRQQAAALQSFARPYRPWDESGATIIGRVCGLGTQAPLSRQLVRIPG